MRVCGEGVGVKFCLGGNRHCRHGCERLQLSGAGDFREVREESISVRVRRVGHTWIYFSRSLNVRVCVCVRIQRQPLTLADAGSVHHPDKGGAVFAVRGDAVLS